MKKIIVSIVATSFLIGCKTTSSTSGTATKANNEVNVFIDLVNVKDDKVQVSIIPNAVTTQEITFHIPKTVPGTYSTDNYGKWIEDLHALDKSGKDLPVTKTDDNSWKIQNAQNLNKVTYWVNDTYDQEKSGGFGNETFSPAGSNILAGKNFVLNNHCFFGFFDTKLDLPYNVKINHPADMQAATSLVDSDSGAASDLFITSRYAELVDNPIMYNVPNQYTFTVDGMDILFSVYSPTGKHSAKDLAPDLEKMMRAQKAFLGAINNNKKYSVLLYLSTMKQDAKGFGALEHNTSTTVCFPEMMSTSSLGKQLIDVVSHEFFHIVTPLGVHANQIHYFDFTNPKMSKHLWMYEGVTEYFANLFQVNQGLISDTDFYNRMINKIRDAKRMNDTMPFTVMSENVLEKPYKDQYLNVYEKGALIGMCIDIIIREKSNGQKGIRNMMQDLTRIYGPARPFNDDELFAKITEITYPEVGEFLNKYVAGTTPINYDEYFAKMGVAKVKSKKAANPFLNGTTSCITSNSDKQIVVRDTELTESLKSLNLKAGDIITEIDGKKYDFNAIADLLGTVEKWNEQTPVTIKVVRDGKETTLTGTPKLTYTEVEGYKLSDETKKALNESWLRN